MGHFTRSARGSVLAVFGVTIIASGLLFAGADGAAAAKAKAKVGAPAAPVSEAEQKQKDASQTRQAYEAGNGRFLHDNFPHPNATPREDA